MLRTVHILLACVAYLALIGCGTKGPLYIPEQRYPQKESSQKTAPQANTDAVSQPAQ